MYKVSVVIPMYNVEEFLEDAIKSLKNQTMGFENIEVILVDDCSTDRTSEIASEIVKLNNNVIYHKMEQNSGMAGKPRNVGIDLATSKYIMFLDPDDFYAPNACEIMYNTIKDKKVNFVTANFKWVDINGNDIGKIQVDMEQYPSQTISILEPEECLQMLINSCWTKIVKKEFIKKNNICFLEGVPAEDAYFTYHMFLLEKKAYYLNEPVVYYRRRDSGNVSETNNLTARYFYRVMQANREIYNLFKRYSEINYYKHYYIEYFVYIVRKVLLSAQLDSMQKAEVLGSMKDLLGYAKDFGFSFEVEADKFKFLEIFEIQDKEDINKFVEKFESILKKMDMNDVRKNERAIINEMKKQI